MLKIGFSISCGSGASCWKMYRPGEKSRRCQTRIEKVKSRSEAVYRMACGHGAREKGVHFYGRICFEGMINAGPNDNLGSCLVQLEIMRALHLLVKSGRLAAPRRTLYFLWPNKSPEQEIPEHPPRFGQEVQRRFNMDMSTEALRSAMPMYSWICSNNLPSYMMGSPVPAHYVWRDE